MRSWVLPPQAVSCVNLAVASVCAHPRMLGTYRKHKRHVPTLLREVAMCSMWRYRVLCVCVYTVQFVLPPLWASCCSHGAAVDDGAVHSAWWACAAPPRPVRNGNASELEVPAVLGIESTWG